MFNSKDFINELSFVLEDNTFIGYELYFHQVIHIHKISINLILERNISFYNFMLSLCHHNFAFF